MRPVFEMSGVQDLLQVYEDRVAITPQGVLGFLNKGLKGTKEIPYASITAVQFRAAGGLVNGFIQFTIPGGNESRGGIFDAVKDENTFVFRAKANNNDQAKRIKDYIDAAVARARAPVAASSPSIADELAKLASLREAGALTEVEFESAKRRLLR